MERTRSRADACRHRVDMRHSIFLGSASQVRSCQPDTASGKTLDPRRVPAYRRGRRQRPGGIRGCWRGLRKGRFSRTARRVFGAGASRLRGDWPQLKPQAEGRRNAGRCGTEEREDPARRETCTEPRGTSNSPDNEGPRISRIRPGCAGVFRVWSRSVTRGMSCGRRACGPSRSHRKAQERRRAQRAVHAAPVRSTAGSRCYSAAVILERSRLMTSCIAASSSLSVADGLMP
jgi:hypothetical protein